LWSEFFAVCGGRSPQRSSINRSADTSSPARRSSAASRPRGLRPPTASARSPSRTSTGPSSRNSSLLRVLALPHPSATIWRKGRVNGEAESQEKVEQGDKLREHRETLTVQGGTPPPVPYSPSAESPSGERGSIVLRVIGWVATVVARRRVGR